MLPHIEPTSELTQAQLGHKFIEALFIKEEYLPFDWSLLLPERSGGLICNLHADPKGRGILTIVSGHLAESSFQIIYPNSQ